jgi:hypothetical protein
MVRICLSVEMAPTPAVTVPSNQYRVRAYTDITFTDYAGKADLQHTNQNNIFILMRNYNTTPHVALIDVRHRSGASTYRIDIINIPRDLVTHRVL